MLNVQKGFTFVELICVLLIMGILSAVVIPKLIDMREQAIVRGALYFKGQVDTASIMNYDAVLLDPSLGENLSGINCSRAVWDIMENGRYNDPFGDFRVVGDTINPGYNDCEVYYQSRDMHLQVHVRGN